ncbi:hypothetical protein [Leucobacter iarius]|uniref:Uncharacterized protein n=1 Tax=Leucobacter iarius TaxID=333963 RepID=A0ABP4XRK2_9MICO
MSTIEQIIQVCGDRPVCLVDGASISDPDSLASVLPSGARVLVIPAPDQAQSVSSGTVANEFKAATGAQTVVVIEDRAKDRFGVASNGDANKIATELNSQNLPDGGEAVANIASTLVSAGPAPSGGQGDGGAPWIVGAGVLILVAVGAAVTTLLIRRSRNAKRAVGASRKLEKQLEAALHGENGEFVRDAIDEIRRLAGAYPELGPRLNGLSEHLSELFVRVRSRGTDQQLRLLLVQYRDTLSKLSKALADDYYGDVQRNPQYWSNPQDRLGEVQRAVDSVDQQAVENIRQVNESRDLEFKVALDSLIKAVNDAKLSDVYSDRDPSNPQS